MAQADGTFSKESTEYTQSVQWGGLPGRAGHFLELSGLHYLDALASVQTYMHDCQHTGIE